jgi:uncharacterized cupin superfamily protein
MAVMKEVRGAPCQSSARHSHTKQDEFVYIIEGEFVLVTDAGRETVGPGTCIAFPAGTGDGHHFLNATDNDAAFLVTKSLIRGVRPQMRNHTL